MKNFFYRTFRGNCQSTIGWHYVTDLAKDRLAQSARMASGTSVPNIGTRVKQLWPFRDRCANYDLSQRSAVIWKSRSVASDVIQHHLRKKISQLIHKNKLKRGTQRKICSLAPNFTQNSPCHSAIQSYFGNFPDTAWSGHSSANQTPRASRGGRDDLLQRFHAENRQQKGAPVCVYSPWSVDSATTTLSGGCNWRPLKTSRWTFLNSLTPQEQL